MLALKIIPILLLLLPASLITPTTANHEHTQSSSIARPTLNRPPASESTASTTLFHARILERGAPWHYPADGVWRVWCPTMFPRCSALCYCTYEPTELLCKYEEPLFCKEMCQCIRVGRLEPPASVREFGVDA